jgi:uncharacterized protein DUF6457
MEWLDELAAALGVPALTDSQAEALLMVSREVAHGVERKSTPLAAFLLGRAVEARPEDPDAFASVLHETRDLL